MRRLIMFAVAVAGIAVLGCSSSSVTDLTLAKTDTNVTGTFSLATAGDLPLPAFAFFDNVSNEWDLLSEKIIISSPNVWLDSSFYQITPPRSTISSDTVLVSGGSWLISNNELDFHTAGQTAPVFSGTVIGNSLTIIFNNARFVYTR